MVAFHMELAIHSTGLVVYKPWALCIILVSSYYWPECA